MGLAAIDRGYVVEAIVRTLESILGGEEMAIAELEEIFKDVLAEIREEKLNY